MNNLYSPLLLKLASYLCSYVHVMPMHCIISGELIQLHDQLIKKNNNSIDGLRGPEVDGPGSPRSSVMSNKLVRRELCTGSLS